MIEGLSLSNMIEVAVLVGGAIWVVATIKQVVLGLRASMEALTESVNGLAKRISDLEDEHSMTRERIAKLEGFNSSHE